MNPNDRMSSSASANRGQVFGDEFPMSYDPVGSGQQLNFPGCFRQTNQEEGEHQPARQRQPDAPDWGPRFDRRLLYLLAQFCRVDLLHSVEHHYRRPQLGRPAYWPLVVKLYFGCCCLKMAVNTYFQYVYDLHLYQYNSIRQLLELASEDQQHQLTTTATHNNDNLTSLNSYNFTVSSIYLVKKAQLVEQRMLAAEYYLKCIGAPFLKYSYVSEIAYLYVGGLSIVSYFLGPLYFSYVAPMNFRFAKVILGAQAAEQMGCLRLVCQEVNRFLVSSRNYTHAQLATSWCSCTTPAKSSNNNNNNKDGPTGLASQCGLEQLLADQMSNSRQLKAMTFDGRLRPLNWSAQWSRRLARYYRWFVLFTLAYGLKILGVAIATFAHFGEFHLAEYQLADIVMLAETACLTLALIVAVAFYISVVFISCLDQIMYMDKLRALIEASNLANRQLFRRLLLDLESSSRSTLIVQSSWSSSWSSYRHRDENPLVRLARTTSGWHRCLVDDELHERSMNSRLLLAFVHFRVFVAESGRERKSYAIFAWVSIVIFFTLPIICRLHEPYVDQGNNLLQVYICFATLVYLNCVLAPICLLHSRALELYKSLCSLLAHTIESSSLTVDSRTGASPGQQQRHHQHSSAVSSQPKFSSSFKSTTKNDYHRRTYDRRPTYSCMSGTMSTVQLYNSHLIWLLRKELGYPEIFVRQFTTVSFGIHFTFPNLVKIHFWFSIIMLSLLNGAASDRETFFGSFLSDPFNVY